MDTQLSRYSMFREHATLPPIPRLMPVSGERVAPSGWSGQNRRINTCAPLRHLCGEPAAHPPLRWAARTRENMKERKLQWQY
jgi:hypothetical protein